MRTGVGVEMKPYCFVAPLAQGVTLARDTGGTCTVVTLGPPRAEEWSREAVAGGADAGVHARDPAFAGSDNWPWPVRWPPRCAAAGPFDLVLLGGQLLDGETGQVGPELAELLDLPFAGGRAALRRPGAASWPLELEHDDGTQEVEMTCRVARWPSGCVIPARWNRRDGAAWRRRGSPDGRGRPGPAPGAGWEPDVVGATCPMEHARDSQWSLDGPLADPGRRGACAV